MAQRSRKLLILVLSMVALIGVPWAVAVGLNSFRQAAHPADLGPPEPDYQPRQLLDVSGNAVFISSLKAWKSDASLQEVADVWSATADRDIASIDRFLARPDRADPSRTIQTLLNKAMLYNWKGDPTKADEVLRRRAPKSNRINPWRKSGFTR